MKHSSTGPMTPLRRRGLKASVSTAAATFTFCFGSIIVPPQAGAAPVAPLNQVAVPDVNVMGLLDQNNGTDTRWPRITQNGQRTHLQQLGKALFFDMQVGGDGIQGCATCHYHAGADQRKTNQMSPGFKGGDFEQDLLPANGTLTSASYSFAPGGIALGFPVSEAAKIAAGATPDLADGTPGNPGGKPPASRDVNDVASSQGPRAGEYLGLTPGATPGTYASVDTAALANNDPGFDATFSNPAPGIPDTARRVEPRNTPTVLNAVYNLRNFWDGRADPFFNGINPLGFRDPDARVKVYTGSNTGTVGSLGSERLRIPFSSLASQAVGPIESDFEMVFHHTASGGGRPHRDLGKKLANAQPLAGQLVDCNDSLLSGLTDCSSTGINRGLTGTYGAMIRAIFDQRFWGDGNGRDVCLDDAGNLLATSSAACSDVAGSAYTLMEWNFSIFFGLSVQAYEAMLTTGGTIVDIIAGGIATGTITNANNRQQVVVDVTGLALDQCIAAVSLNNSAAQQAVATDLCTRHYSKFIHRGAVTGKESAGAPFGLGGIAGGLPVPANTPIGGCVLPTNTTNTSPPCSRNQAAGQAALMNVDRGLNRFFAGATGCSVCHFNPEFTGATVSALTGFGAAPAVEFVPPAQVEAIAVMERMVAFNGLPAVYDSGFYNLGVRPTPEDISLGDQIGGVPLAFTKLAEVLAGGDATGLDSAKIARVGAEIPLLFLPTAVNDLTPVPFNFNVACGPGLVGNGNANNNANAQCVPNVIPGERLLRNGAFKAAGLRNVKFTGPFFHNGSKMDLRQVLEFYQTAGSFVNLNFNNLDAGLRLFALAADEESAVVEMMETGLTDWRVAYEEGPFDHPEICVPHGHDPVSGRSVLAGIPAVGSTGGNQRLQTFEEQLNGVNNRAHNLHDDCTVTGTADGNNLSLIDVPPAPAVTGIVQ